jgi:hypothetical protein
MQAKSMRAELLDAAHYGILFTLNLPDTPTTRSIIDKIFGKMIATIIDFAVEFDQRIVSDGVQSAAKWVAHKCGTPAQVTGIENVPLTGPVLMAANHPGYFDSLVLISQFAREDVKAIVGVPYFNYIPNASTRVIYTDRSMRSNVKAVREAIKHLQSGGFLLLFPTGHNDPDPDVVPGAHQRFEEWSDSVSLFLRKVPETQLVPTVISGIVAPQYFKHLISRIQPNLQYKQRVAELFQIYSQFMRRKDTPLSRPRVSFSSPLRLADLTNETGQSISSTIQSLMQQLLTDHMGRFAG